LSIFEFLFFSFLISSYFEVKIYDLIYSSEINNLPKVLQFAFFYIFLVINIIYLQKKEFKEKITFNFKYLIKGFLYSFIFLTIYFLLSNFNFAIKNNTLNCYILLQCFFLSIFIAFIEELIFRFFLYENLKFIGNFSKILVSYIYAQLHFQNLEIYLKLIQTKKRIIHRILILHILTQ